MQGNRLAIVLALAMLILGCGSDSDNCKLVGIAGRYRLYVCDVGRAWCYMTARSVSCIAKDRLYNP